MADITPRISPINAPKKTERQLIEEADMDMPEVSAPAVASAPSVRSAPSVPEIKPIEEPQEQASQFQHPTNQYADVANPFGVGKSVSPTEPFNAPIPGKKTLSGLILGYEPGEKKGPMHLFKDEQEAYQKMLDAGYDDAGAHELIKQRRSDLMGGNTRLKQSEAAALMKMREAGLDAKTAVKFLNEKREADEAARPAWKKAGEGALNFAAGNLQTIAQYGGNTLDFLTAGKLGAGEEVKQMLANNARDFGDSSSFTVGSYAPDVAMTVAPGGALLKGGKAVAQGAKAVGALAKTGQVAAALGKSAAIGAGYGAVTPILNKGSEATGEDISTGAKFGAAAGAILPIAAKGVQKAAGKAWQYVSKALPERLQISGQLTKAQITKAAERFAKLTGKDVDPKDTARWMLDREIRGGYEQQLAGVRAAKETSQKLSSDLLGSKSGDVGQTTVAQDLREGLKQLMGNYAKKDANGNLVATAGNREMLANLQALASKESMTLKEFNEARKIIGDSGIFRETGDLAQDASKKGLQNTWIQASKFLEEKVPGFRKANKDTEIGMALEKALIDREAQSQAAQMVAYLGIGGVGGGTYGYSQGGDIGSAIKGAAAGLTIGQLAKVINSPAVKSRLAFVLNKLSPSARQSIEQLKKGVEIEPEAIKLVNSELKGLNLADLAQEGKVGTPIIKPIGKKSPVQPFTKGAPVSNPSVAGSKAPQFGESGFIQ